MEEGEESPGNLSKKVKVPANNTSGESPSVTGVGNKVADDEKAKNTSDSLMVRLSLQR